MILGDENNEEISKAPQSQILGRHDPNKSISGHDSSLMMEKSGVILSDGIGGESSDNPHTQILNSRNQRSDGDIPPRHLRAMNLGDENNEAISKVLQIQTLGRHHPSKSISGRDSSLMMEKSGVILSDGIGGESNPHTQKLNWRNQRSDEDILPRHVRADGSIAVQESMNSTLPPWHKVFNYSNTSLFGLAAVKFQGKSKDPFIANPASSWSYLAAMVMYIQISLILMQFRGLPNGFLPFLKRVASASGVVSSLLLMSLLLPKLPGLILVCASWALFIVISGWPILNSAYGWLHTKIITTTDIVISFAKKLFTSDITSQQRPLV